MRELQEHLIQLCAEGRRVVVLIDERIGAARRLLARVPDNSFSLQLFATDDTDPTRMERFLARASAVEAGRRLPPKYRRSFHATPRSFADVRHRI